VGVQLVTGDIDGDHLNDLVIGNKRGVHVLLQRRNAGKRAGMAEPRPTLDFETGDLTGWVATGDAFAEQPIAGETVSARGREPSHHAGKYWIGSYERFGDGPRGTLTSNPFVVEQPWASFLVGGGTYTSTRVEVVLEETGKPIFTTCGANYETMQRVAVDLRAHLGKQIRIRLVDQSSDEWGHINFDDFRFHAEKPVIERDPRVPQVLPFDEVAYEGLSPEQAVKAMTMPDGFHAELIAAEPNLHQPVAFTIDDRGRLWVAEAFAYPNRKEGDAGPDDIVVFEDADHDGTFEKRTVFLTGLNLVSGLEVGFGGVWIGAAPYLLFVPDRDQDLVPDGKPQVLLDGWAWQDTHETLNTFTWGPDGWLYGCHGVFTHSNVGKPGASDAERTPINAGVWRYHPTRHEFEVFAWGTSNPWGLDFDRQGQAFITACVIPHLYHMVQGGRYQRQAGGHFDKYVFDDIKTIADHRHFLGPNSHSANLRSNSVGGGHAHCGLMLYLGGAFPEAFDGGLFFDNIHGNRINHDRVERSGSGFIGHHATDLLLANDRWFRGINLKYGPEGSVYLIDWYDKQACHLPTPESWDRSNGRLYRLSYGKHVPRAVDLGKLTSAQLVDLLADQNEWYVRHARRLLQERGVDPATAEALRQRVAGAATEVAQLRAMWALHGIGGLTEELCCDVMRGPYEYARGWAIQLALEDRAVSPATLAQIKRLAESDPSPVVRMYLASALQRLPNEARFEIAERLVGHGEDAADHNIPFLLWYGMEPLVAAEPQRAVDLIERCRIEQVARFLVRRLAAEPRLHATLVQALAQPRDAAERRWMLEEAVAGLSDQRGLSAPAGWSELSPALARDADPHVRELGRSVALAFGELDTPSNLRRTLADRQADPAVRRQALEALVRAKDAETAPILRALLDDAALRGPVIRACAVYDDAPAATALVTRYASFDDDERRDALGTLSSRPLYASQLLEAIRDGSLPRRDVGAFLVRKIESLGDAKVTQQLHEIFGQVRATSAATAARIAELKTKLAEELGHADRPHGRQVFARTCQPCHTLFGTGGKVGPELTGANRNDLGYLLSNVLDPNAVVGKDYLATIVWTRDGRVVTGIQRAETETSITLQSENETIVLARSDIKDLQLSDLSTMPEGLLDALTPDEIRDLFAYLQSPVQVAILAAPGGVSRLFDGRTLDGWQGNKACWSVESGEIVGRTSGLERNEFLVSEVELADFKLTVDVKLVEDRGNSGVQFRSKPLPDGDIQGYQADVGPGWWGKLYEEHGRGLVWDHSGEQFLKRGEWNRYEIEAIGPHIRTWLNGHPCVDLDDPQGARRGVIALQLHSGGPTEVRFRNLTLDILP
jgi:putative membrane-bound dehydrogenase-like protein